MFGKCLYCQSKEHQGRDCKKIVFRKGSCCVSCGFPQKAFGESIHEDVRTGECEEGMRDIMKGICWGVYYHYNPVTEPFSTSIIWIRWIRNLCGSVQRIQMAVTEPPWLLLNPCRS